MKHIILLICCVLLLPACTDTTSRCVTVTFRVALERGIRADRVFLSGSSDALGRWKPDSFVLTNVSDSVWTGSLTCTEGEELVFKVNAGSWWEEAVDSTHHRFENILLHAARDTTVTIRVFGWLHEITNGKMLLSSEMFTSDKPAVLLDNQWRYRPGDSPSWAAEAFDDDAWATADTYMRWLGDSAGVAGSVGWFRFHAVVDSSLWNRTLALSIGQLGASDVYYNGTLLYSFGEIGDAGVPYGPSQNRLWKALRIEPKRDQVIAVRYANREWKEHLRLGFSPGFVVYIRDMNTVLTQLPAQLQSTSARQMVFTTIPFILFILHLIIYAFYPVRRENLFYAISLLGFAGITYFGYERFIATDPDDIILFYRLNCLSMPVAIFFGMLTGYAAGAMVLPKRWRLFCVLFIAACAVAFIDPIGLSPTANYAFFGVTILDLILSMRHDRSSSAQKGEAIILSGFIVLIVFVVIQLLVDFGLIPAPFGDRQMFVYGLIAFTVAMSLYLSLNFAAVNKDLLVQLETVKELSEQAIEQEKVTAKLELESRLREAENDRKTRELESARTLQLSLLPKEVPSHNRLGIGCYMRTATEVGGDYYDFFPGPDGAMTAVIGDATGHGLKAGMMVILSKGLFTMLSGEADLLTIMREANRSIKTMNLNQLTMCMSIARISGSTLTYSSAGIPPLLIYRKETRAVEHIVLKAMPLGAFYDFPYASIVSPVHPGDILLMMTDGLSELFDAAHDTYGIDRVADVLAEAGDRSAEEIVRIIAERSAQWAGTAPLADDLTIVAVKVLA